jgi:hypothetical protein
VGGGRPAAADGATLAMAVAPVPCRSGLGGDHARAEVPVALETIALDR